LITIIHYNYIIIAFTFKTIMCLLAINILLYSNYAAVILEYSIFYLFIQ
jgi:hypothetical protein